MSLLTQKKRTQNTSFYCPKEQSQRENRQKFVGLYTQIHSNTSLEFCRLVDTLRFMQFMNHGTCLSASPLSSKSPHSWKRHHLTLPVHLLICTSLSPGIGAIKTIDCLIYFLCHIIVQEVGLHRSAGLGSPRRLDLKLGVGPRVCSVSQFPGDSYDCLKCENHKSRVCL